MHRASLVIKQSPVSDSHNIGTDELLYFLQALWKALLKCTTEDTSLVASGFPKEIAMATNSSHYGQSTMQSYVIVLISDSIGTSPELRTTTSTSSTTRRHIDNMESHLPITRDRSVKFHVMINSLTADSSHDFLNFQNSHLQVRSPWERRVPISFARWQLLPRLHPS